jgi:hypothetical protein
LYAHINKNKKEDRVAKSVINTTDFMEKKSPKLERKLHYNERANSSGGHSNHKKYMCLKTKHHKTQQK